MPLFFKPEIREGKVYRTKKNGEEDEKKKAFAELQSILNSKNRKSCDCEAQIHDLLENCLNCGRLTCISEGAGRCFSCGNVVMSEEQRERLMRYIEFDQTTIATTSKNHQANTSRVKIIDNQFDQSSISNKHHLRAEDKQRLKENLNDLQETRYKRKLVLNVNFNEAEAQINSVPLDETYDTKMRGLKISEPKGSSKNPTLVDVLSKELQSKQTRREAIPPCDSQRPIDPAGAGQRQPSAGPSNANRRRAGRE